MQCYWLKTGEGMKKRSYEPCFRHSHQACHHQTPRSPRKERCPLAPLADGELRRPAQEGAGRGSWQERTPGAETPAEPGLSPLRATASEVRRRGCLRPLKGERPGWPGLAGVRPASSPWTAPGWASKAVPRGWQRDRPASSVRVHSSRGPC